MSENCALCGTGGTGICPDCAESQIEKKRFAAAYRIIDAFETWDNDLPREAVNPVQTIKDIEEIRERYTELKWKMSFADAARIAKAEFMMRILEEVS